MKKTLTQNLGKYFFTFMATTAFTILGVQAWQGLTAENGDTLDYNKWNQLVTTVQSGIPSGFVGTFNLSSCPSGWSAYTPAVGRTVIGVGNGAGSNTSLGDLGGDKSKPSVTVTGSILVSSIPGSTNLPAGHYLAEPNDPTGGVEVNVYSTTHNGNTLAGLSLSADGGTAPDNMQPYVALLYCQKN